MSSTAVTQSQSNKAVRGNGAATRLATECAGTQIVKPQVNVDRLEQIARELRLAIGENPEREGLRKTPTRFAKLWKEFIDFDPGEVDTTFESVATDQMVVVSGMKVFSMCEHHLLPFWSEISVAYIASDHVLGLSKFARIAHKFSHRLQVQEQLVDQIAAEITQITGSRDVAVLARGEHLCMQMRGVKTEGLMTTSVMRGLFRSTDARMEFLTLALGKRNGK
jgi:GTP cyclohydrolase I